MGSVPYQYTAADTGQLVHDPFQAIGEFAVGYNKNGIGIGQQV